MASCSHSSTPSRPTSSHANWAEGTRPARWWRNRKRQKNFTTKDTKEARRCGPSRLRVLFYQPQSRIQIRSSGRTSLKTQRVREPPKGRSNLSPRRKPWVSCSIICSPFRGERTHEPQLKHLVHPCDFQHKR